MEPASVIQGGVPNAHSANPKDILLKANELSFVPH